MEQSKHEVKLTSKFSSRKSKTTYCPCICPPAPLVKPFCGTLEIKLSQWWCGCKNLGLFLTIIIMSVILFRSQPQKTVILAHLNRQQQTVKPLKVVLSLKHLAELHLSFVRFTSSFKKVT